MTLLQMVQAIQKELRLPESSNLLDAHSLMLVRFINKVQRDLMAEAGVWDELKVYDHFHTADGTATYEITIANREIDVLRSLRIGTYDEFVKLSDLEFREKKSIYTVEGQPLFYRIYSKSAGKVTVELLPVPGAIYQVDMELLVFPPKLSAVGDEPLLDAETIIIGATALARSEQGSDSSKDDAVFGAKLGNQVDTQSESNWGDVEAV